MAAPKKTAWSERDAGERFSIVMFGLCLTAVTVFMIYVGFTNAIRMDWWGVAMVAAFLLTLINLVLEWRRRDAR